jgi:hypothetical protein
MVIMLGFIEVPLYGRIRVCNEFAFAKAKLPQTLNLQTTISH